MPRIHSRRTKFDRAIADTDSPSAMGAVELMRAAFWVLSYPMPAQALLLLRQALEVAYKGLLEEIHILLTADRLDYSLSKYIAADRLRTHRLGRTVNVDFDLAGFDPDKTCGFEAARTRVCEMVSLDAVPRNALDTLSKLRNEITHKGANPAKDFDYLDAILNIALPAIEEFYRKAYDGLELRELLGEDLYRELQVARQYCQAAKANPELPRGRILHTFECCYHHDTVRGPANMLYDSEGRMLDIWESRYEVRLKFHRDLARKPERWGDIIYEAVIFPCRICGEGDLIVGIEQTAIIYEFGGHPAVDPCSLFCPSCGLNLDKSHSVLAKLHHGPITEEMVGAEAWASYIAG